ncbi:MAG: hypothetical protein IJN91_04075 [Alphaproteobacteria bacterium]|nr:hypothetical protein [Alphaproteobacteria bacterium]
MKKTLFVLLSSCLIFVDAFAVTSRTGRSAVNTGMQNSNNMGASARERQSDFKTGPIILNDNTGTPTPNEPEQPDEPTIDPMLEEIARQRNICMSNNVGISNTFVWADRNSDTSNYMYMVENIDYPENNACFVKVDLKSSDGRIDLSDIKSKYFIMGTGITCGQWADESVLEQRILDATKKGRTWGTVAATVGGAGLGVGAMEAFGNRIIGGAVMGQKDLEGQELLRSQLLSLKKSNKTEYNKIYNALETLESECNNKSVWTGSTKKPAECDPSKNVFLGLKDKLK